MAQLLADHFIERLGKRLLLADRAGPAARATPLGWAKMDDALPDGGMPRGIVELRSAKTLGGGTSIALGCVRSAHRRDRRCWCAWVDPEGSLYSPGIAMAGVDLNRLAVVRPPRTDLLRIAIKVARSRAFDVIVVDVDPSPGAVATRHGHASGQRTRPRDATLEVFVRKLSLLVTEANATALLLTDASIARSAPLPVALRLELSRTEDAIGVRVAKDRHGRIGAAKTIALGTRPGLEFAG